MECYTYLQDVPNLLTNGHSQNLRRSGESFTGPIILFGALVGHLPNSERDKARIHQFGKKVSPGIFEGYALVAARIWEEDILNCGYLKNWKIWIHQKCIPED